MRTMLGSIAGTALLIAAWPGALGAEPPAPGTISVEPRTIPPELGTAAPAFASAIARALAAKGFTVLEGVGHAGLVADVSLSRAAAGTITEKVPVGRSSLSPGGASGVGASMSLNLPTSKVTTVPIEQTRLEIRIHRRGDDAVLWQAAAITVRPADNAKDRDVTTAASLANTLFRIYPAQPDDVVSVP